MNNTYIQMEDYKEINNERLLNIGINNPQFSVLKGLNEDVYKYIKKDDLITIETPSGDILCDVKFKYRDAKDVKIFIRGKIN